MPDLAHLDDNAASEFVSGSLSPAALTRVEGHLASCRDCRALVAALAMDAANDSNAQTSPHEKLSPSQVAQRPTRVLTVGDRVGRYLVLSTLGAGGMGVVFAAYDPQLDRKIALKLLRAGIMYNTKDARARLRREAQAIAQLSHPNVVNVYDVGNTDEGDLYIAMEFVEGDTLTTWLKKYPRSWREIIDVFLQAARGLIAAHSQGLLHRDFKPDNVLVGGDGRVRVTDFGLARSVIEHDDVTRTRGMDAIGGRDGYVAALHVELTATGTVLGTPRYMAPEQLTGPDIDARADQFSFSVALYEALYGAHPLTGATSVSMLEHNESANAPPETVKVPSAIARAVLRGLERDRSKRFASMSAMIAELIPAPNRSPFRFVALAMAVVVVGGAVAATRMSGPRDEPSTGEQTVDTLVKKIDELQTQLSQRDTEIRALVAELKRREPDTQRIQQLQAEIAQRDETIDRLMKEFIKKKPPRMPPPPGEVIHGAIARAHRDLESCFAEWSKRQPGDLDLVMTIHVSAAGTAHGLVDTTAPDPSDPKAIDGDPIGPATRQCASDALLRVQFPPNKDDLELTIGVQWSADVRSVNVSARITGRRPAAQID